MLYSPWAFTSYELCKGESLKNILVTGGAGFIGSNFVHFLLREEPDVRVVNLDALTYAGSLDNLRGLPDPGRHTFVEGEIGDRELVERLLQEHSIDTVVHFAAESHVDRSIHGPAPLIDAAQARELAAAMGDNSYSAYLLELIEDDPFPLMDTK